MNRIDALFEKARKQGRTVFSTYLCCGDPDLETTIQLVVELANHGVDMVEIGVPFSDPVADGPVIQNATQRALKQGTTLKKTLDALKAIRERSEIPICLMTYYNPVFKYGEERLVEDAIAAGADGLIVPDLTGEEAGTLIAAARARDCKTIFFATPTSTDERIRLTNHLSTGFIYCVSVTGITGAREGLPPDLVANLKRIRSQTDKPLVVGFGVSKPAHVAMLSEYADGVIVGSALIRCIEENLDEPREKLVKRAVDFASHLAGPVH